MKTLSSLLLALLAAAASAAPLTYRVVQSVGSLSLGQPGIADPYLFLDFQLTDGSGLGNGNSTVAISNLGLTGGTIDAGNRLLPDIGNVAGAGGTFTLRDGPAASGALADRAVLFRVTSPTAVLTYDFTVDSTAVEALAPDGFNVALLYRTGPATFDFNVVQSLGPTGNEMVAFAFDADPTTGAFAYSVSPTFAAARAAAGDARFGTLGAPVVTQVVPEPASLAALGLGALGLLRRRRA